MIYFDNSATTKPSHSAMKACTDAMENVWGNPSSTHAFGTEAFLALDESAKVISRALSCQSDEVFFTSGGTEANNIAIFGAAMREKGKKPTVVVSAVEHPSVLNSAKRLSEMGYPVKLLDVDSFGAVELEGLEKELDESVGILSVMLVNNETGNINQIKEISKILRRKSPNALFHVDCVQAFGKMNINVRELSCDLLTVSSHKVHGPKGVGALFVKSGVRLKSPVCGGEQQFPIRPGTENMPGILGFAAAVREFDIPENTQRVKEINDFLRLELEKIGGIKINSPKNGLPHILNISVLGYKSETLLNFFSEHEIYLSAGSACAKGAKSPVLKALGLKKGEIDSALRLSFCESNTKDEAEEFLSVLKDAMKTLRHL